MQEDVGEERADARPLPRLRPLPALQDTGLEPLANEPQDPSVGNPVCDHPQQPLVIDRVEEAANVRVEHPVHALGHHCGVQRRKRQVRAPRWPKPVRETQEIDFVDGAQHLGHRSLDNLVLQGRYAEGPLATVRFRDVHPPDRLRLITPRLHALAQVLQLLPQVPLVARHRFAVDSCAGAPPQPPERPLQRCRAYVMHQRRESSLLVSRCCLVHSRERRRRGDPALRPDLGAPVRVPLGPAPSLHAPRFLRRLHQYYEPVRLPVSARRRASVFPRSAPPPVDNPTDPTGSPGSRC